MDKKKAKSKALKQIPRNPAAGPANGSGPGTTVASPPVTPQRPEMLKALELHQQGKLDEAVALYEVVLEHEPHNGDVLQLLGLAVLNLGDAARAVDLLSRSIEINPAFFGSRVNLGAAYKALGNRERAVECYDAALELKPDYVDGWIFAGNLLGELNRVTESLARFDAALRVDPTNAGALNNRGNALRRLGQHEQALACFDDLIAREPNRHDARLNRGVVLLELGRNEAAVAEFDALISGFPGHALAWNNRGNALTRLRRYAEAIYSLDKAIDLAPDYPPAWVNRGNGLLALCRYGDARKAFERAKELAPGLAGAHWNLANLDLLEGRFAAGWPAFEARWHVPTLERRRHLDIPAWLGDADLTGKRVLLWHEQGFGDTVQFCRYARDIAARGAIPVLEVQTPLKELIAGSLPGIEVVGTGEPVGACDFAVPLMSLPHALGVDLTLQSPEPAYLRAAPERVAAWSDRVGERSPRLRVGLAISGNPGHNNDANRSIPLRDFAPIMYLVDCVILQKGLRAEDAAVVEQHPGVRYVGDQMADFSDTAAAIEHCDLVISVDTSVAHLAAALGKPTWLLVPANPDWRWQLERQDSPWYASVTLLRQPAPADWNSVIGRIARSLQSMKAGQPSDTLVPA